MKKTKDKDCCEAGSCGLYKAPGSRYCFSHRGMYPEKKVKVVEIDKFNTENFTSQIELFKYKWDNSTKRCYVTGECLKKYEGGSKFLNLFAHVLRKSAFKEFRLYPNNIVLLSPEIHTMFDNAVLSNIKKFEEETNKHFDTLFELEELRYNEYAREFGRGTPIRKIIDRYNS
jgi:hypothetical protein